MSFEVLSKKEKNWLGQEKDKPFAEVYSGKVITIQKCDNGMFTGNHARLTLSKNGRFAQIETSITNAFLQEDKTDLENQIVEAKKKADYYEAHYNVNYEIWLKQTKQIVEAVKILNEPNTLNSYCLNNQIKKLREALK